MIDANREVYKYNDVAENFYMILKGKVSCQIRNYKISNWDLAMNIYQGLLEWKSKEFDIRVQKQMQK